MKHLKDLKLGEKFVYRYNDKRKDDEPLIIEAVIFQPWDEKTLRFREIKIISGTAALMENVTLSEFHFQTFSLVQK